MSNRPSLAIAAFALFVSLSACSDDEDFFDQQNQGSIEQRRAGSAASLEAQDATSVFNLVDATYAIVLRNAAGPLCTGQSRMRIDSQFALEIVQPTVTCLGFTFDLSALINSKLLSEALKSSLGNETSPAANLSHDGSMLLTKKVIDASFDPPRPLLVGPVIVEAGKYQGFAKTYPSTMSYTDPKTAAVTTRGGNFAVRVLEPALVYTNGNLTIDRVMHWEVRASGFEGIPAIYGMTFTRLDWHWSTRPLMIPKIEVDLTTSDLALISAGPVDSFISGLLGTLTVSMSLTQMTTAQ